MSLGKRPRSGVSLSKRGSQPWCSSVTGLVSILKGSFWPLHGGYIQDERTGMKWGGRDTIKGCCFPGGTRGKEHGCQCRRGKNLEIDPWVGKIPCSRTWQPTPVFLPGEFHGQRSLVGYSPWGCKESDTTEWLTLSGLLCMTDCRSIHIISKWPYFILFSGWTIFNCIYVPHFLYPFTCHWTFRLFHALAIVNSASMNKGYMCPFELWFSQGVCLVVGLLGHMVDLFLVS